MISRKLLVATVYIVPAVVGGGSVVCAQPVGSLPDPRLLSAPDFVIKLPQYCTQAPNDPRWSLVCNAPAYSTAEFAAKVHELDKETVYWMNLASSIYPFLMSREQAGAVRVEYCRKANIPTEQARTMAECQP